mmetsp:Transcript_76016/g.211201  ORF Transcript_76016/g.211201 Transcript_76016/m.211201 type:complete len:629 (-) Transcript_76016:105-1991(-)
MAVLVRAVMLVAALVRARGATNFLRAGEFSKAALARGLRSEVANSGTHQARIEVLKDMLRTTYVALPKNADATLGHQASRYILHRFFMQRSGWLIRGLEANGSSSEWAPSYLQTLLEKRQELGGHGLGLRELAVFAATLEDFIHMEAARRVKMAYELEGLPQTELLSREMAMKILDTYFVAFLTGGRFRAANATEAEQKVRRIRSDADGWTNTMQWTQQLAEPIFDDAEERGIGFADFTLIGDMIGNRFHKIFHDECRTMKSTLSSLAGRKTGRIRLSAFYREGLSGHWKFIEKVDYLRNLGAIDDSDEKHPHVIISNYVGARQNCIDVSSLYAVCCNNECEELVGHLERMFAAPTAAPERIAEAISKLPSSNVAAPRNLSDALLTRLQQVAAEHGGQVRLHSRLFAQWMHHAYPLECPYPHEQGLVSPQTADEWLKETGNTNVAATKEEMQQSVENDACDGVEGADMSPDCGEIEIPWSDSEELFVTHTQDEQPTSTDSPPKLSSRRLYARAIAAVIAGLFALDLLSRMLVLSRARAGVDASHGMARWKLFVGIKARLDMAGLRTLAALSLATLFAWALGLVDGVPVICAVVGASAALAAREFAVKPLMCTSVTILEDPGLARKCMA